MPWWKQFAASACSATFCSGSSQPRLPQSPAPGHQTSILSVHSVSTSVRVGSLPPLRKSSWMDASARGSSLDVQLVESVVEPKLQGHILLDEPSIVRYVLLACGHSTFVHHLTCPRGQRGLRDVTHNTWAEQRYPARSIATDLLYEYVDVCITHICLHHGLGAFGCELGAISRAYSYPRGQCVCLLCFNRHQALDLTDHLCTVVSRIALCCT